MECGDVLDNYIIGPVPVEIISLELLIEGTFVNLNEVIHDAVGWSSSAQCLSMKEGGLGKDNEYVNTYAFDGILHVIVEWTNLIWSAGIKRRYNASVY